MMEQIFIKILNLSIKGSWVILAVIVLRMILQRMPKKYMIVLWAIAGIRLILPFSIKGLFSLIPHAEPVPQNIMMMQEPVIHSGFETVDQAVNPVITETFSPAPGDSVNPLQIVTFIATLIWIAGLILMTGYLLWSWLQVRKMTAGARQTEPGIYEGKMISAPFVCGAIRPRIYLPENLDEHSRGDILLHEKMHIARHDTLIRMIAYLILSVHWFNPLVWLARHLFITDTELACDEAVISRMKPEAQKHYAKTILDFAYHRHSYMPVYASFEEAETKKRIRNLVRWKKPTLWTVLGALCICLITGCGFLSDPEKSGQQEAYKPETETLTMEVAVHSPDELPAVHYCENPALIEEFTALFAELSQYSQNDHEIIVQKDGFESIPDVFLTCGTKVMTLLRQDFSKETQSENMSDAWYAEFYEDNKIKKQLIIPADHSYGLMLDSIVSRMNTMPFYRNSKNSLALRYMISLIEIPKPGIYVLKDEMIYSNDHYKLTEDDTHTIDTILADLKIPAVYISDTYSSAGTIGTPAENEKYRLNACRFIEIDETQKEELFNRLTTCTLSLTFLDTDTQEKIRMAVNPGVNMMSDPDYPVDHVPTPESKLAGEYRIYPDNSDRTRYVRLIPHIENGTLIMDAAYVKDGTEFAGSPIYITPDESGALENLSKPFRITLSQQSQSYEGNEVAVPLTAGRYGLHISKDGITFYSIGQNGTLSDIGMTFPAYNS